jgi:hypothetical protein
MRKDDKRRGGETPPVDLFEGGGGAALPEGVRVGYRPEAVSEHAPDPAANYEAALGGRVALGPCRWTLAQYALRLRAYLDNEARIPAPDTALIELLCEAAKVGWEYLHLMAGGPPLDSGMTDNRGRRVRVGDTLVEANGYVEGQVRFERGAFRVHYYVVGNVENKTGWGSRPHGHDLGDYYVGDRLNGDAEEECYVKEEPPHACALCAQKRGQS